MQTATHSSAAGLFDLLQAPLRWQLLATALQLHLFDLLEQPKTVTELVEQQNIAPRKLTLVLNALTAMGMLTKNQEYYTVAANVRPYLLTDSPFSLRDTLLHLSTIRHGDIESLLTQEITENIDLSDARFWDHAAANLRAFHQGVSATLISQQLEALPQWPNIHRILDLGAGSTVLAQRLAQHRTDLQLTLLDLPPLAARLRQTIEQSGQNSSISVIAGDYNNVDWGQNYDLIWASMTLYYAHDLPALLRQARQSLAENGIFISFHEGLTDARTQPAEHVIGRLVPALKDRDYSFAQGEIAAALLQAGFSQVDSQPITTPFGMMERVIGYR